MLLLGRRHGLEVMLAVPAAQRGHEGPTAASDVTAGQTTPHAVGRAANAAGPEVRCSQGMNGRRRWRVQMRAVVGHGYGRNG